MASKKKAKKKVSKKAKRKYVRKLPSVQQVHDAVRTLDVVTKRRRRRRRKNKMKVVAPNISTAATPTGTGEVAITKPTSFFAAETKRILSDVKESGLKTGSVVFTERRVVGNLVEEYSVVVNLSN